MFLGSNLAILTLSLAIFAITAFVAMLLLIALAFAGAVNAHNGGDKTGTVQPNQDCASVGVTGCPGPGNSGTAESVFNPAGTGNQNYAGSGNNNPTADPSSEAGQHANTDKTNSFNQKLASRKSHPVCSMRPGGVSLLRWLQVAARQKY
jgi:hypothetical protein